jgi:hypothetical protein
MKYMTSVLRSAEDYSTPGSGPISLGFGGIGGRMGLSFGLGGGAGLSVGGLGLPFPPQRPVTEIEMLLLGGNMPAASQCVGSQSWHTGKSGSMDIMIVNLPRDFSFNVPF